jgi:hypothetical protein
METSMKVLGVVATFVFLSLSPTFAADQTIRSRQ